MPTPRVAFFLRTLGGGGAERILLNLSRGCVAQGLEVDLVLSAGEGLDLWEIPAGVRVVDLQAPRVSASIPSLIRYLQREQPAAIVPSLHYANEVALLAKYLARVPTKVLIPEHNVLSTEVKQHEKSIARKLIPFVVRSMYPFADAIVAVSHGVAADLMQMTGLPKERIHVIYNPVIFPDLHEKAQEPVDHPWFQFGEPPVILGVGRLEDQKDFPTLIRAFAQVRQVRPARLVILGWGPDRPQLEALAQELGVEQDLLLPGFVNNPFAYMSKSAVFALSSAWEGLPTVLIEAMALKIPVVSTDCKSGPAEILANGQYGTLVPVGDSKAMATAILEVLSGDRKQVDADWLKQFTLKAATEQYLKLISFPVEAV